MRRVVVTGLGVVSPLGLGAERSFAALLAGRSGIRRIEHLDVSDLPSKIAGQVPRGAAPGQYDPKAVADAKELRRYDEFILFALAAADEAVQDSGWQPSSERAQERTGVLIGSGIGGLPSIAENAVKLDREGPRRISPYFIPGSLINEASGVVSIRYGFKGPNHAVVTACATGAHALGDAARLIAVGDADVMLAGGTEAATCRLTLAGFAIMRALSTGFNDRPEEASRPWDRARDGFVIGEGAGAVVLEELEHARARGARIYAELGRLWTVGRRVSLERARPARRRRAPRHGRGARARPAEPRTDRLHQRARHLDSRGGSGGNRGGQGAVRAARQERGHVVDQVGHGAPARRGRRGGGDLLDPRLARRRAAAHAQSRRPGPGVRSRSGAARGQAKARSLRALQLVRLRRHERGADLRSAALAPGSFATRG